MHEVEVALVVMNAVRAHQLPSRSAQGDISKDRPVDDGETALRCNDDVRSIIDRAAVNSPPIGDVCQIKQ
jgi:hypothetical protein